VGAYRCEVGCPTRAMLYSTDWTSGASPRFLASTKKEVYYASEQSVVLVANSMKIVSLNQQHGREGKSYTLKTEDALCMASCSDLAFISWYDKPSKSLKLNVLGSSRVITLAMEKSHGEEIRDISILPCCRCNPASRFLVHVQTTNGAWAEVFHINADSAEVRRAYSLPYLTS
jgi:hypothetical protein